MAKAKKGTGNAAKKAASARSAKIVEDKTFGLKNKKKSAKVQKFIATVQKSQGNGRSKEAEAAHARKRKEEKLAQKAAEREMMALLGDSFTSKDKKVKKKKKKAKTEAEKEALAAKKEQEAIDFAMPIVPLCDVFRTESKAAVPRVCAELVWKNNLTDSMKYEGKTVQNLFCKLDDGTTLNPVSVNFIGESASSCEFKVGQVIDIRGSLAMVRGGRVDIEVVRSEECTVNVCSERLAQWVKDAKAVAEEDRARGGVPIEELIEAQRAELRSDQMTPVTLERFLAWKEKKKKQKEAQWEQDRKAAQKKSGGKGLNVLTGRALFAYDQSLFKDDEGALDNKEYDEVKEEEEAAAAEAAAAGAGAKTADATIIAAVDGAAVELQESLYVGGDDDELDDLDDLDSDDDDEA